MATSLHCCASTACTALIWLSGGPCSPRVARLRWLPRSPDASRRWTSKDKRIVELERANAKLTARLELSEKVVAFQKKAQELFAALSAQTTP